MKILVITLLFAYVQSKPQLFQEQKDSHDISHLASLVQPDVYQLLVNLQSRNAQLKAQNEMLQEQGRLNDKILQHMDRVKETLTHVETARMKRHNYSVSFFAYATLDKLYDANLPVVFDKALVNDGGFYAESTGTFVCPETGHYLFSMNIVAPAAKSMELQIGGVGYVATYSDTAKSQGSNSMVVRCEQLQQVYVMNLLASTTIFGSDYAYTSFSGVLLFPELL